MSFAATYPNVMAGPIVASRFAAGTPIAAARPAIVGDWNTAPASYQDCGSGSSGATSWNRYRSR
jgi:hypothetical protein